eukprot:CAMPEP_0174252702 /NCGR_PEP_ID=MMETSP0439-20130205/2069_1 /TAXON_ID=0 /ORGANISM="Stereomyxa ramosa, Strain Chinc5" /LENGTH=227 /DNA_ID=CAMNT_0015333283 /DNA_START=59 /DNA_END=742 /DNA_ORIENTATION=+
MQTQAFLLLSLAVCFVVANHNKHDGQVATFTSTESMVSGEVSFIDLFEDATEDGVIQINLDLTDFNWEVTGLTEEECLVDGMNFHVHMIWEHDDINSASWTDCGSTYTGGHWDPTLACGPASGNSLCDELDVDYNCTSSYYPYNPYKCEVGDWSNKYGRVYVDSDYSISAEIATIHETPSDLIEGRAIVFHCTDDSGTRAFCALFESSDEIYYSSASSLSSFWSFLF